MGQLLSQLADRIFIYVLMILAYTLTRSNLGVSIPMLSFGIPSILFGSLAGVYADRLDRKGIMVISCILRGLLILLLVPLVNKSVPLIFLVSLFIYTVAQFFAPAESSSIPELVEKKNLIVANSLFVITWMGASMLGFGLWSADNESGRRAGDLHSFSHALFHLIISDIFSAFEIQNGSSRRAAHKFPA